MEENVGIMICEFKIIYPTVIPVNVAPSLRAVASRLVLLLLIPVTALLAAGITTIAAFLSPFQHPLLTEIHPASTKKITQSAEYFYPVHTLLII
jgi:flagellar basal body-associated protein FliL